MAVTIRSGLWMMFLSALLAGPATAPSTQPGMKLWFDQLADRDPDVREQARFNLMGISRRQLPELLTIVQQNQPLEPSQIAELHDIVTHVFLTGESYQREEPPAGFLGLSSRPPPWEDPPGIVVERRIKGFCAYRVLRDGDVLVGISEMPGVQFTDASQLTLLLRTCGDRRKLTLEVLRGGRIERLPVILDLRPIWVTRGSEDEQVEREKKAEKFWDENFGKLIPDTAAARS